MNKTNPPKNREFLGLVDGGWNSHYWDIFFWATKEDGVGGKACFTDRMLYDMPTLVGWMELPPTEERGE